MQWKELSSDLSGQSTTSSQINPLGMHTGLASHFHWPNGHVSTADLQITPTASSARQLWMPQLSKIHDFQIEWDTTRFLFCFTFKLLAFFWRNSYPAKSQSRSVVSLPRHLSWSTINRSGGFIFPKYPPTLTEAAPYLKPNSLHTTLASFIPKPSSHTCPQSPKTRKVEMKIKYDRKKKPIWFKVGLTFPLIMKWFFTLPFTFNFYSTLARFVRSSQTYCVVQFFWSADIFVGTIATVVFTIANFCMVYALSIGTCKHAIAVNRSVDHFVVFVLDIEQQISGKSDVRVA